jgi:Spy/CpxP family protein refolding chaperone
MSEPISSTTSGARRRWLTGVALAAAFVTGGLTVSAVAAVAQDAGMGGMHAMVGGPGHGHAAMIAHVNAMLDGAGATADQKAKIETILHEGLRPMMEAHRGMQGLHADLMRALTGPTVDRAALEQDRAAEIARLDQASRAATQALADAAEVLTPAQRDRLRAEIAEHRPPS